MVAVAFLAACGGSGGKALSRTDYASKADAVCSKYSQQTKALGNPSDLSGLATVADKTLPILGNALTDLKKLKPPAEEQDTVNQWLAQVENLKGDLKEIRDKAKTGDAQGVRAVVPQASQHNQKSNQLASKLGMSVCNKD